MTKRSRAVLFDARDNYVATVFTSHDSGLVCCVTENADGHLCKFVGHLSRSKKSFKLAEKSAPALPLAGLVITEPCWDTTAKEAAQL